MRVARGVEKVLDIGKHGVIDFAQIRFEVRDRVVDEVFPEDEFVAAGNLLGCGVGYYCARDIESLCEG